MPADLDFSDKLSVLIAGELTHASCDPDRMGVMIERVAAALGLVVATAARGNGAAIDELMTGAEGYAHAEATAKAPFARMMAGARHAG